MTLQIVSWPSFTSERPELVREEMRKSWIDDRRFVIKKEKNEDKKKEEA